MYVSSSTSEHTCNMFDLEFPAWFIAIVMTTGCLTCMSHNSVWKKQCWQYLAVDVQEVVDFTATFKITAVFIQPGRCLACQWLMFIKLSYWFLHFYSTKSSVFTMLLMIRRPNWCLPNQYHVISPFCIYVPYIQSASMVKMLRRL